jgi:hypothetical protein
MRRALNILQVYGDSVCVELAFDISLLLLFIINNNNALDPHRHQACHAAYDTIDETAVYACTGSPEPQDISYIIRAMAEEDFTTAYSSALPSLWGGGRTVYNFFFSLSILHSKHYLHLTCFLRHNATKGREGTRSSRHHN